MGCFPSKSKPSLEITKQLDRSVVSSVTPLIVTSEKQVERTPFKHKAPDLYMKTDFSNREAPNAIISDKEKTSKENEEILKSLSNHFLLNSLPAENLKPVIDEIALYTIGPKEKIYDQNSPGENFYIISAGKLQMSVNGKIKKYLIKFW